MAFWRSWVAGLLRGSGTAAAVPVALVLFLAVSAGIGPAGGLGGLGQLTSGPRLPGIGAGGPAPASPLDGGVPVLPRGPALPSPGRATAVSAAAAPRLRPASTGHPVPGGPVMPPRRRRPPPVTPSPRPPAVAPAPVGAPVTAPAGAAGRPHPLRELVTTVQGAVAPVPLLGRPVSDAVGSVADLIIPPAPVPRVAPGALPVNGP